jgi:nitrogen fixation protein FixH
MKLLRKVRGLPRWGMVAVALLGLHVSGMLLAVRLATSDSSFASTPDFYTRAVAWDDITAQRRASDALGWSATFAPSALAERIVIDVVDASGAPVDGLAGSVRAFLHTRPKQQLEVALEPRGGGVYFAAVAVGEPGAWQVALVAQRGDEVFVAEHELVVRGHEHEIVLRAAATESQP